MGKKGKVSHDQNRKSLSSHFLCPKTKRNRLLRRLGEWGVTFKVVTSSYLYHYCSFSQHALRRTLLGLASSVRLIESQIRAVKEGRDQLKVSDFIEVSVNRESTVLISSSSILY